MIELSLKNISISRASKIIYKDFSLSVEKSQILALIAPSGRGKTTLLDFIADFFPRFDDKAVCSGQIEFSKTDNLRPLISYVFQEDRLIPQLSVLQNVMLPLKNLMEKSVSEERAILYLKKTGLESKINDLPKNLSGGERQRVSLARAFAYPSEILLMDEPFQSQDIKTKSNLIELFLSMQQQEKRTVIFVSHEIRESVKIADRILVLDGNPISILADFKNQPDKNSFYKLSDQGTLTENKIIKILTDAKA